MSTRSCGHCRHWRVADEPIRRFNNELSGLCKIVPKQPFWLLIIDGITLEGEGLYCEAFEEKPC